MSARLTGSDVAMERVRGRHGELLLEPLPGQPLIDLEFIRWHREPGLGGVFRGPALGCDVLCLAVVVLGGAGLGRVHFSFLWN